MLTEPERHRWLLITGAPRSGTTFLGNVLSLPREVNSLLEPFNPHGGIPWVKQRYLYVPRAAELTTEQRAHFEDFFRYRFVQRTYVHRGDSSWARWRKRILFGSNVLAVWRAKLNPWAKVTLIKDPIAVFLTELLAELRPLVTFALVRHPLSYVGSLKRLNWDFRVTPLLEQPVLRERYLFDFDAEDGQSVSSLEAAAWTWLAVNRYLLDAAERQPALHLLSHEVLSEQPLSATRFCYERAGLNWTPRVERYVHGRTNSANKPKPRQGVAHDLRRSSKDIFTESAGLLDARERDRVLAITEPLSRRLYARLDKPELSVEGAALLTRDFAGRSPTAGAAQGARPSGIEA